MLICNGTFVVSISAGYMWKTIHRTSFSQFSSLDHNYSILNGVHIWYIPGAVLQVCHRDL